MQKGFSLVELIVSVAIISTLSTIGITSYASSQRRAQLDADVISVYSAIRKAQNRALSPSKSDFGIAETDELCALGVDFQSPNRIRPFAISRSPGPGAPCGSSGLPKVYRGETLLSTSSFGHTGTIEVLFSPPFAQKQSTGNTNIQIRNSGNTLTKTITISSTGLIKTN